MVMDFMVQILIPGLIGVHSHDKVFRCYAEVQWGWGNEIQSLGTPTEQGESKAVKGKSKILNGKRAVGVESFGGHTSCSQKSSGEGEIVTGIQTIRPKLIKKNRVVSQAGGKERDSEEGCLDNVQTRHHRPGCIK